MKKTEKIKYEIDPHNRLIFTKTGVKSKLPKYSVYSGAKLPPIPVKVATDSG